MRTLLSTILDFPTTTTTSFTSAGRSSAKRPKLHHLLKAEKGEDHNHHIQQQALLPDLPDHIAQLCLSLVPPSTLYSVCHSWRQLIYDPSFPPFLSLYALFEKTEPRPQALNSFQFCSFDPISCDWKHLPPPPPGLDSRFLLRHPSFISRKLPIQSVAVSGKLIFLAATADQLQPALSKPLIFDPITKQWAHGPSILKPRRWCAAGASRTTVFVASGIGSHYNTDVARSVDKWDLNFQSDKQEWSWEKMRNLKDGKFSRDAIEAVGWRGKLCMVNVKGDAAKDGTIYDVETDSWQDMPEGMLAGWRGPAAAMEEETIYVVDESKGSLKRYDQFRDMWEEVVKNEMLKGAQQIAVARGKVCVLRADGGGIVVVDVAASPARLCVVDAPPGLQGVAIHILPRLSQQEIQTK
ncbi:F-box/kelch-repeat protein SKIP25-like [Primulina huaijiensis]|uniref:F-box/kelch-repeat protein SKIP25-like n=1 Tax=Primulina huaijiensis TaxID=1492673 RepID=UPI003CC73CA8